MAIVTARLAEDELIVIDCASNMLRVDVEEVCALRKLRRKQLERFTIAEDGSYLHWPGPDVHLGLDF